MQIANMEAMQKMADTIAGRASRRGLTLAAGMCAFGLCASASAEIVSFAGRAEAEIVELINGSPKGTDSSAAAFPETTSALPLQVVAALVSADSDFPSAGAVAAQFADPTELNQLNPEEFAINLTLNSISKTVAYSGKALSQERREILLSPGELGFTSTAGRVEPFTGAFFLDGGLAIIAADATRDLTGAIVRLTVSIDKQIDGAADQSVFQGQLELTGAAGGQVTVSASGDFPVSDLILTDLAGLGADFGAFHLLVIPNIAIEYPYNATIGQKFTLVASVRIDATNIPDNVGVAAVLGTPSGTLPQVLGTTNGSTAATKVLDLITAERANPTGAPAFSVAQPAFGVCGLFGLEALIGAAALAGWRTSYGRGVRVRGVLDSRSVS